MRIRLLSRSSSSPSRPKSILGSVCEVPHPTLTRAYAPVWACPGLGGRVPGRAQACARACGAGAQALMRKAGRLVGDQAGAGRLRKALNRAMAGFSRAGLYAGSWEP